MPVLDLQTAFDIFHSPAGKPSRHLTGHPGQLSLASIPPW